MATDPKDERLLIGGKPVEPGDPLGPYTYVRPLGSGGMARVLLVKNHDGEELALKILRRSRLQTGLPRFRREFHALSRIDHPNVVGVFDYGELEGHPYIAMECVDGPDLHQLIRGMRSMPDAKRWTRVESVLVDLCRALAAIHERGLVHRDLKPSNVLMTHDGVCKLTDFGIVKDLDPQQDPHLSTTLVGTWAYTSPEHISGRLVDHRSDLYSLGVILFALLTGRRPFIAESMAGYLTLHRDRPAPLPSSINPDIPQTFDEVCRRLLAKRPRDRFQSAQEVLYHLEVDDALALPQGSTQWVPPLVGPPEPADQVSEAVNALTARRGGVVRVLGTDGSGKTRLLQVAMRRAKMLGLSFHHLEFRSDAPPFARSIDMARELLRELPEEHRSDLERLVAAFAEGSALRGDTRYAIYDSIRAGLEALLAERPRMLVLDDLHEAREPERQLVGYLVRSLIAGQGLPLLLVSAERPAGHAATDEDDLGLEAVTVTLKPLTSEDLRVLVGSLVGAGRTADLLAGRLHRETEGNPYFATEFLRSLIAQNLLTRTPNGFRLTLDAAEIAGGHLEVPPGIRQLVRKRITQVSEDCQRVLEVLAVHGQATDLDVLLTVLDMNDDVELLDHLDTVLQAGLVVERRDPMDVSYRLSHRKLADVLLRDLSKTERTRLHGRLAMALEAYASHEPETMAVIGEHYRRSGYAGKAYEHLVAAAQRLVDQSLADAAWELSEKASGIEAGAAQDLTPEAFQASRVTQLRVRGNVLYTRGAWSEAEVVYAELLSVAEQNEDWALATDARLDLATALRRQSRNQESLRIANSALTLARKVQYREGVAEALHCVAALSWSEGDLARCEALATEGLLVAQGEHLAEQRARLLLSLTTSQATRGQLASSTRGLQEAEQIFRSHHMKRPRVLCLANLAELLVWQGVPSAAEDRAQRAHEVAEALGYRLGLTASLRARGVARLELGLYWKAQTDLLEALKLAVSIDVIEEIVACRCALTQLAIERNDLAGARHHGAEGLKAAQRRDTEHYLPLLQVHLARALAHHREPVARSLIKAVESVLETLHLPRQTQAHASLGWAWMALGDRDKVREHATKVTSTPNTRAFKLLHLEARTQLVWASHGEEADRHKRAATEQAKAILNKIAPPTSELILRRPLFRRLGMTPDA